MSFRATAKRLGLQWLLTGVLMVLFGVLTAPAAAVTWSPYDDFSGGQIDLTKWSTPEIVRQSHSGALVSGIRMSNIPGGYWNDLAFANPGAISSIQADVTMTNAMAPSGGSSRIRLKMAIFNDGSTGSGDVYGDVYAEIYLREKNGGVSIGYDVFKCASNGCKTTINLIPDTQIQSANLNDTQTLTIQWSSPNITFTVGGSSPVALDLTSWLGTNSTLKSDVKALGTKVGISNAGGEGYVLGTFANVKTNTSGGALYDDFSSTPGLNTTKWILSANGSGNSSSTAYDVVRNTDSGVYQSTLAYSGVNGTKSSSRLVFMNQNAITAMKAAVTVNQVQTSNASAEVRLIGAFYNDGASIGAGDQTGDIMGMIRIQAANSGQPTAQFHVVRCGDSSCASTTNVTTTPVNLGTVSLGSTHNLLIAWDASITTFTYALDGATGSYDASSGTHNAPISHTKDIRTQVGMNATGGYGYIAATFGDVQVNSDAAAAPALMPSFQQLVHGDVITAGVGLKSSGSGTITLSGLPIGATIERAYAYGVITGTTPHLSAPPTLNGTPLSGGTVIGQSDDPFTGSLQTYVYRVDVTSLVQTQGNRDYTIAGFPADGTSLGAALVVVYSSPSASGNRVITINDGAVMLASNRLQYYSSPFGGFSATTPPTGATLSFLVGNGGAGTPDYAGLNSTGLGSTFNGTNNEFGGSGGSAWDTKTYDISSQLPGGATTATASLGTGGDTLIWVAAVLSVPGTAVQDPETSPYFNLNVSLTGGGAGSVTSATGINCGTLCNTIVMSGSLVTLTATLGTNATFIGWGGDCAYAGTNTTCQVDMTQARNVSATFNPTGTTYNLTVTPPAHGTVLLPGFAGAINCGTGGSACSADIAQGAIIALIASPDTGSLFLGWTGACHGTGPCVLNMSQARGVGADFAQVPSFGVLALSLLHSFNGTEGATPYSGLIPGGDGFFYGVTSGGGAHSLGTAFKMDTNGAITTLHSFAGDADGSSPYGALLLASDGNFYGTTFGGGGGGGTVFRMDGSGNLTHLHSFGGSDGSAPWSRLIQGTDGNLYGTTMAGGSNNVGTIFRVDPAGAVSMLHTFTGLSGDGKNPYGGLTQGTDGYFYGTTANGGSSANCGSQGCGTIFKMDPTGTTVTKIHDFSGSDGATPTDSFTLGRDGYFYGTTTNGGSSANCGSQGCGTIFKMDTSGNVTTLHNFAGSDGANPQGDLFQGSDGNFYGMTSGGGASTIGSVFKMDTSNNATTVHSFANSTSDGNHPWYGGLIQTGNGNFYGMTSAGGAGGFGTAFVLQPGAPLTVSVSGAGLVSSSPAGISCSVASCSENFASGQTVTLTASPASGSYFAGWSGDCTGATCQVTMNAARNVTATFMIGTIYPLNVSVNGTGLVTSSPGGINCSVASCSAGFVSGGPVTLTASGSFTGWGGACTGQGANPSCTVMMSSSQSVTANFSGGAGPYPLTVNVTGAGLVTSSPGGINCSVASCSAGFVSDANISLMANPASGSSFNGWGGDCGYAGTSPTCMVDMNTPHTVSAAFTGGAPSTAVLTVYLTGSGVGTVTSTLGGITCPGTCGAPFPVNPSTSVTLTAAPASGSSFLGWSGEACTGTGTCTVFMGQDRTLAAMFGATGTAQFATSDLAGTWSLYKFNDSTAGNSPDWNVVTATLDTTGTLVSGSYIPSDSASGSLTGGTFVIDPVTGLVAGSAWTAGGGVSFPYGSLDSTKTIMSSVASEESTGRGLAIAIKAGGSFTLADLAGTWHIARFTDNTNPTSNNPTWTDLTITLDGTGALVSGSYIPSDGASGSFTSGAFTIDANGFVTGSLIPSTGSTLFYPYGKLDPSKTTLAVVASGSTPTRRSLGIGTKAGGSFTPADLAGTWNLAFYGDNVGPTNNNPNWTAVTLTLNTTGSVLTGTFVDAQGNAGAIASGSFSIDGAGLVSGFIADGPTFPTGSLNPGKTLLALAATDTSSTPYGRGLMVGSKGVAAGSALYATFTGYGVYSWNGSAWSQLSPLIPASMVAGGSALYATFTGYGVYSWNGSAWSQLSPLIPASMVAGGSALYATFTGYGVYSWNGSAWSQLSPLIPASMVAGGSALYATFTGYGVYSWNGSAWSQLSPLIPASMVAGGSALYATFTGYGVYSWNGSAWSQLSPLIPASMVAGGSALYATFTGYGVYSWNGSAWSQLSPLIPASMVAGGSALYATFTGYGVYSWNGSAWTQLSPLIPASMVAGF